MQKDPEILEFSYIYACIYIHTNKYILINRTHNKKAK